MTTYNTPKLLVVGAAQQLVLGGISKIVGCVLIEVGPLPSRDPVNW